MSQPYNSGLNTKVPLEEQIDLREIYQNLYANKCWIASAMAACFVVAALYFSCETPIYSSNVLLQMESGDNSASLSPIGLSVGKDLHRPKCKSY